ncbi:MAG: transcriptional repressor [Roseitalea sp.]|uniref:Ferric uptake regulation protein n=1 Tax=Oceaniradius stylonematis TaxID=2184161 RepID=A0A3A8ADX4_9HYPH|nr:Fur family transcriptional regulator [Oceaniradius stylonematis]MBO6553428.1 transcriptional repressor [Roseitalea sp.]MBO6952471.1 transcriptional repressor [Rhizobiaceae bacterium]RNC91368.1 MAG: transcriptional repressor [Oricola sp.]MBO6593043.1 transcriptional repressor [Roseitalea sp.]MBO6600215.1 transcriptional repressor [Roseitalea sp.]
MARTESAGAHSSDTRNLLQSVGLRPTRQRVALASMLFGEHDQHIAAEDLHRQALDAGIPVSLATVYNTLHQFTDAGLLRILAVEGQRTYFDTNTSDHHHFFIEESNVVMDVPEGTVTVGDLPTPPEGMEIANVDVVIRLRPTRKAR